MSLNLEEKFKTHCNANNLELNPNQLILVNQLDKGGTSCGQLGTVWNSFHSIDRTIPASSGSKCSGSIVVLS